MPTPEERARETIDELLAPTLCLREHRRRDFFRDERDPEPRSRRVLAFHQPETLAEWVVGWSKGEGIAGQEWLPTL